MTISFLRLFPETTHSVSCSEVAFPTHKLAALALFEGSKTFVFSSELFLEVFFFTRSLPLLRPKIIASSGFKKTTQRPQMFKYNQNNFCVYLTRSMFLKKLTKKN
jgi:hypothetical protein